MDDGNDDWRVKFLTSGTFTPNIDVLIDAFLVGGGGGSGGGYYGGGNNAAFNTGGGGGGDSYASRGPGGTGGSGIVIIRNAR